MKICHKNLNFKQTVWGGRIEELFSGRHKNRQQWNDWKHVLQWVHQRDHREHTHTHSVVVPRLENDLSKEGTLHS